MGFQAPPPLYDLVWSVVPILLIALVVLALISIARNTAGLSSTATAVWAAVVLFVAPIGPIAWFIIGRPAARASAVKPTV